MRSGQQARLSSFSIAFERTGLTLFHSPFGVPAQSAPRFLETPMNKKLFGRLLESMRQHSAIARGERAPSRVWRFSSSEIHTALFPKGAADAKSPTDTREGIRMYVRRRRTSGR